MGMAYLRAAAPTTDGYEFEADTGSNDFFAYNIGRPVADAPHPSSIWGGGEFEEITHVSHLQRRPVTPHPFNRTFRFHVPSDLFSRTSRHLQLVSYRDPQRNGPAQSAIIPVPPHVAPVDDAVFYPLSRPGPHPTMSSPGTRPRFQIPRREPFAFQESALSRPLFLNGILDALRILTPTLLDALPSIIGRQGGQTAGPDATGDGGLNLDTIVALLRRLTQVLPGVTSGSPPNPTEIVDPPPPTPVEVSAASLRRRAAQARNLTLAHTPPGRGRRTRFSRQQILDGGLLSGPILAGLMGPLLQQAPQLLQVLADKPLDFLTTLLQAEAQQDLQREQNQQNYVAGLLAQIDRSMLLDELLQRLGGDNLAALAPLLATGASIGGRRMPSFGRAFSLSPLPRESQRLHLRFNPGPLIDVNRKAKSVFLTSHGLSLQARLHPVEEPPRSPLPRSIAEVCWYDVARQKKLLRKSFQLLNVSPDSPLRFDFTPAELAPLPRHSDLRVTATLRWPTPQGTLGVRAEHTVCLTDGPLFGRIESGDDPEFALADVHLYRSFWNKIWENNLPENPGTRRWKLDVVCRYYLTSPPDASSNARIETRLTAQDPDPNSNHLQTLGRMKSGMELSVEELNQLLPALHSGAPLPPEQLAALKTTELRQRFDLEATTRLRLRGDHSHTGVIWVYPAVVLREVVLLNVAASDEAGQVTAVEEQRVRFPFPSSVHFLTLRST